MWSIPGINYEIGIVHYRNANYNISKSNQVIFMDKNSLFVSVKAYIRMGPAAEISGNLSNPIFLSLQNSMKTW